MALTIAVGFVVDDAIVMLENIVRHIEDGLTPARGGAQGRRRDRLHHRLDQPVAGRRVHPAAADERHRRPAVPRVRGHGDGGDPGLGVHRADPDADDVLALPQERQGGPTRPRLSVLRADVRPAAGGLRMGPEARAEAISLLTLCVFLGTLVAHRGAVRRDPEKLLSGAGHGIDFRQRRGCAGHLLRGDVGPSRRDGQDRRSGSGRRRRRLQRGLLDLQQRQLLHHPEAAMRSAERAPTRSSPGCAPSSPPSWAPISICRSRRTSRSAAGSAGPSTNTRCRTPISTSSMSGRPSWWRSCRACSSSPTSPAISRRTPPPRR